MKKLILIIPILIVVIPIILVYFTNNGIDVITYDTHKGYMTLYEVMSTLITLGSLLVIYLTLIELKNQRESVYKPDIVLKSSGRFYMYDEQNGPHAHLPSLWLNEDIVKYEIISQNNFLYENNLYEHDRSQIPDEFTYKELCNNSRRNIIPIPIYNIGKGAAKNIEINWNFNQKSYQKEIKDKNEQIKMWKKFEFSGQFLPSDEIRYNQSKIDFITPSEAEINTKNLEYLYIPYDFQMLFNKDITLNIDESLNMDDLNYSLKLHVTYADLTNKRHQKLFKFIFYPGFGSFNFKNHIINRIEMNFKIKEIEL